MSLNIFIIVGLQKIIQILQLIKIHYTFIQDGEQHIQTQAFFKQTDLFHFMTQFNLILEIAISFRLCLLLPQYPSL